MRDVTAARTDRAPTVDQSRPTAAADVAGLIPVDLIVSPLPGQDGNVEFFCWLRRTTDGATAGGARLQQSRIDDVLGGTP